MIPTCTNPVVIAFISRAVIHVVCVETPAANAASFPTPVVPGPHTLPSLLVAAQQHVWRLIRPMVNLQHVVTQVLEHCGTSVEPLQSPNPVSTSSLEFLVALAHAALVIVLGATLLAGTYVWGS
jgi:hypothetical protein